jgi:hypothetical protein
MPSRLPAGTLGQVRTDPTDNGGLFIGRRPGTAPVRYRALPERGSERRRRVDSAFANVVLLLMAVVNLLFWGPLPALSLWIASQVQFRSGSVMLGITVGFAFLLGLLFGALMVLKRIDRLWILLRRAAGFDQRSGVLGVVFGVTAAIGGAAFAFWLIVLAGPGSSVLPG